MNPLPDPWRRALVNETISQPNKMHCAAGLRERGFHVEYRFSGETLRTRMSFQFEPDGPWLEAKSFEFDVRPHLKWAKEMKR